MKIPCRFLSLNPVALFNKQDSKEYRSMLSQNDFNIIYEFLDRVPVNGHNERIAMNSVIIKLQEITEPDNRRREDTK